MARWDKKDQHRDEDYPKKPESVESVELVEPVVQPPPPNVVAVKVGDKVGDIVITVIEGKRTVMYCDGRLILPEGSTVWATHKDLGGDAALCFNSGKPKVVGLDKAAFKAGIYKLL